MNILHLDSCALGDHSASRQFTAGAVALLATAHADSAVTYRDLAAAPLSHLSGPLQQALRTQWNPAIPMSAELNAEVLQSASLLQELSEADVIVLGAPMVNFSIPSTLKAWLDRLLQAGRSYELNSVGPGSLMQGKRVVLVSSPDCAIGGLQQEALLGHQEANLQALFHYMGVKQVEIVRTDAELETALAVEQTTIPHGSLNHA